MTKTKYQNNEELVLQYQAGDDYAFSELFENNQGMIRELVNKYNHVKVVDVDVITSACYMGFLNASKTYVKNDKTNFSSYFMKLMEREIFKELKYIKSNDRDEMIKNSESVNRMIPNKEGETEAVYLLDAKEEEVYFEDKFILTQNAIDYAMDTSTASFKEYIVPILCEDYSQTEVAKMFNRTRQAVEYQVRRFKKYMMEYMNHVNINSLQEALN